MRLNSTARTVQWRLKKEEKEKYVIWPPTWERQLTAEDTALLKFTNDRRIDEVHRDGIETIVEWQDIDIYDLLRSSTLHSKVFDVSNQGHDSAMPPGNRPLRISVTFPAFYCQGRRDRNVQKVPQLFRKDLSKNSREPTRTSSRKHQLKASLLYYDRFPALKLFFESSGITQ
jgi:hypothetical protein